MSKAFQMPGSLFRDVAQACVPPMRRSLAELGMSENDVSPSVAMTAEIEIDGKVSGVRVECTLAPERED